MENRLFNTFESVIFPKKYSNEKIKFIIDYLELSPRMISRKSDNDKLEQISLDGKAPDAFIKLLIDNNVPFDCFKYYNEGEVIYKRYVRPEIDRTIHFIDEKVYINSEELLTIFENYLSSNPGYTKDSTLTAIAELIRKQDPISSGEIDRIEAYV